MNRPPLLVFYDKSEKTVLGAAWAAYAHTFLDSFGVESWDEVRQVLKDHLGPKPEVQVWGHGWRGRPLLAQVSCPVEPWWGLAASVWFRSCATMDDSAGLLFAERMAKHTDVAGHLNIIGFWGVQSWLVGARKGTTPWWKKHALSVDSYSRSNPLQPRTVLATRRRLPQWAFDQRYGL